MNGIAKLLRHASTEAAALWSSAAQETHLRGVLRKSLAAGPPGLVTVYAQDPTSAAIALEQRRKGYAFRLVSVVHYNESEAHEFAANGLTHPGGRLWNRFMEREARVLPQVDKLLFVSDFMRRTVTSRLSHVKHAEVIPNAPGVSIPGRARTIVAGDLITIGTLEPRKNHAFLLRVVGIARSLGREYRLTVVGDGPLRNELERQASSLGIAPNVRFLGYVHGAADLIAEHRVLAHAARMENLPIVLLEAMQRGVPLLAPAVGGIPEMFDDGVEGRFWPLDDERRAAEVLIETLESEPRRTSMGAAAHRRFLRGYSPDALAPRWLGALFPEGAERQLLGPEVTDEAPANVVNLRR
jgi:glycosyltransferase involved in cell wall biosynthesis